MDLSDSIPREIRRGPPDSKTETTGPGGEPVIHHTPVLVREVIDGLRIGSTGRYIDCTVGEGGHAKAVLEAGSPGCRLLGVDADPRALETARLRLAPYGQRVTLVHGSYTTVEELARNSGFLGADGILMDLGLSSLQLEGEERGFSFRVDGPLDMRFDPTRGRTAEEILNRTKEADLAAIISRYGEERQARRISRAIVGSRPIRRSGELAALVERAVGGRRGRIHPATRTFQAIRMAVNEEMEKLEEGLNQVIKLLGPGGRLAVISYHSLEDRMVKRAFQRASSRCICPPRLPACVCGHVPEVRLITKKPITPSLEEVRHNPRSRSARLRVAEHVEG
jgi:16S rRNA (cytosine1402-N4)-methyltransferase